MSSQTDSSGAAQRWAEIWQRAWEALDLEAVVALYAEDAVLSTQPFRVPYRGRDGVREYVGGAFGDEEAVRAWVGEPVVDGDRVAIEWWAALREAGEEVTLAGTSVLRFDPEGSWPSSGTRGTWLRG